MDELARDSFVLLVLSELFSCMLEELVSVLLSRMTDGKISVFIGGRLFLLLFSLPPVCILTKTSSVSAIIHF